MTAFDGPSNRAQAAHLVSSRFSRRHGLKGAERTIDLHCLLTRRPPRHFGHIIVVDIIAGVDTHLGGCLGLGLLANKVAKPGVRSARLSSCR